MRYLPTFLFGTVFDKDSKSDINAIQKLSVSLQII